MKQGVSMLNIFRISLITIVIYFVWDAYNKKYALRNDSVQNKSMPISEPVKIIQQQIFECDGRQHCSQMTSCAEAKYFIQHCPNTKMDGDRDGVPCERQWCN